ncbi:MAG: glycosyltransferase [Pyrinomonadaceae bacterium]
MSIDVSVIISTYNRCHLLPAALASVLAQEAGCLRYELIVVDNNSTDDTRGVVESFMARGHENLRYVFEGQQGLSYGWNAGIAHSRGEIIAFTDDDLCVAPDWVSSIKRAFDEHPEVDFIGGKVLPRWETEPPAWLTPDHWAPLALADYGEDSFYSNASYPKCLLGKSFRREALELAGGFAPEFGRKKDGIGSTEDHELQMRLWAAGKQGLYVPAVIFVTDVPADRMTKAYHRRWHAGHGKYCAMMRLSEIIDHDGRLAPEPIASATLLGVPAYIYRELLTECGRWLRAALSGPAGLSFLHENQARYFMNYIRQTRAQRAADGGESRLAEMRVFASHLLRKR